MFRHACGLGFRPPSPRRGDGYGSGPQLSTEAEEPSLRAAPKESVQPVGDADPHDTFCLSGFRSEVIGEHEERVIEGGKSPGERLAVFGEADPILRRNEQLRNHHVLQSLDLAADRGLARIQYLFFLMIRRPPRSTLFPYTTPLRMMRRRPPRS